MTASIRIPLFLLALTVAVGIKVAVHDTEQMSEKTVDAQVSYNLPDGVILVERVKEVEVLVRGPRNEIALINPIFIEVFAEIDPNRLGQIEVPLEPSNVRVPVDIQVVSIAPNPITVELERVETAVLPIRIASVGEPAAGARVADIDPKPDWVNVRGPLSLVRGLEFIEAEAVSVDRKAITFEDFASIISPDPLITVEPSRIRVTVSMEEPELSPIDDLEETSTQ